MEDTVCQLGHRKRGDAKCIATPLLPCYDSSAWARFPSRNGALMTATFAKMPAYYLTNLVFLILCANGKRNRKRENCERNKKFRHRYIPPSKNCVYGATKKQACLCSVTNIKKSYS